jgi:NAD(P)-dependent dehydrogenase (short-subunit alcohol dehydrogenase family)
MTQAARTDAAWKTAAAASADWLAEDTSVTRLLELSMLVAKHFGDRLAAGRFAATILDPLVDLQPHPDGAQFAGFIRSLAWEIPPDQVLALITDATPAGALDELAAELRARRDTPVAYYRGGLRHTETLSPAPLPEAGQQIAPLGPEPVIVAVGGARGIAAAALPGLVRSHHPVLWILGRSDPDTVPPQILTAADADQARLRSEFVCRGLRPGVTPGELSRVFDRHWRARQTAATLTRLRALGGPDRVRYLPCDITDATAVAQAAATIIARHHQIDLLLNSAVQQESAQLGHKRLDAFRRVVATKVGGFRNLKAAFAAAPPRLWCNFGSSIVLLGLAGETDYAAGSEFLAAAARYETRLLGGSTTTIGWGLWEQAGSAADPQTRTRLTRAGVRSGISDAQGCSFLASELAHPRSAEPAPLYLTADDHDLAQRRLPATIAGPAAPGLLGEPVEHRGRTARWAWHLHSAHDRYLLEHLIDGRPVLPGMCLAAMAAQAATTLVPGLAVIAVRDLRFHEFVWADPRRPGPTKYRLIAEASPPVVRVRLLSDVVADGRVLRRDRCHGTLDVLLGSPEAPPRWNGWGSPCAARQADPCGRPGSAIHLTGVFRNTMDIQADHDHAYARCQPALAPADVLSRALLPVLLLDALGRTSCFVPVAAAQATLHAPVAIDQIDLYTQGSDSELMRRYPAGIDLYGEPEASRYTAVAPDGTILARITGLHYQRFGTQPILPLPETTTRP